MDHRDTRSPLYVPRIQQIVDTALRYGRRTDAGNEKSVGKTISNLHRLGATVIHGTSKAGSERPPRNGLVCRHQKSELGGILRELTGKRHIGCSATTNTSKWKHVRQKLAKAV